MSWWVVLMVGMFLVLVLIVYGSIMNRKKHYWNWLLVVCIVLVAILFYCMFGY
jgi:hypothetical protein